MLSRSNPVRCREADTCTVAEGLGFAGLSPFDTDGDGLRHVLVVHMACVLEQFSTGLGQYLCRYFSGPGRRFRCDVRCGRLWCGHDWRNSGAQLLNRKTRC